MFDRLIQKEKHPKSNQGNCLFFVTKIRITFYSNKCSEVIKVDISCIAGPWTDLNNIGSHLPALQISVVNDNRVRAPFKSFLGFAIKLG